MCFPILEHFPEAEPPKIVAAAITDPTYEVVALQQPTTSTAGKECEHLELTPITIQQKKIEVAPNAAYATVQTNWQMLF